MIDLDDMRKLLNETDGVDNVREIGEDKYFKRDTEFFVNGNRYTIQWFCNLSTLCSDNLYSGLCIHFDDIKYRTWSCTNKCDLVFYLKGSEVCYLTIKMLDWVEEKYKELAE